MTYFYDGAEYIIDLDTSTSHLERIWVNLRPVSSIETVNGVGDDPTTGTEEAVKGADWSWLIHIQLLIGHLMKVWTRQLQILDLLHIQEL